FHQLPPDHFKSISIFKLDPHNRDIHQTPNHAVDSTEINVAATEEKTNEGTSGGDDSEAFKLHMKTHAMEDSSVGLSFCDEDRPLQSGLQGTSMELQGGGKTDQSNSSGLLVTEGRSGDSHSITPSESSYRAHTVGEGLREVGGIGADDKV
ncbi:hypothetical protein L218DRAFT_946686, partial [Marasmius fiardii PR-910]